MGSKLGPRASPQKSVVGRGKRERIITGGRERRRMSRERDEEGLKQELGSNQFTPAKKKFNRSKSSAEAQVGGCPCQRKKKCKPEIRLYQEPLCVEGVRVFCHCTFGDSGTSGSLERGFDV